MTPPKLKPPKGGPWSSQQILVFTGSLTNGTDSTFFSFNALCGPQPPTITGGWAKIAVVDRMQRLGFTIPQGYDPVTMDVQVQFEAVVPGWAVNPDLEGDIQRLHWMAGRGKLYATKADHGVGQAATGDPPLVTVASYEGTSETDLVPRDVQGINWLINNIAYDTSPQLDRHGSRIRQLATISLTEFSASPEGTYDSPTTRASGRGNTTSYQTVYSTGPLDTIQKLVEHHTNQRSSKAFRTVLDFNRAHGLKIKSVTQKLKAGTKVLIPSNLAD